MGMINIYVTELLDIVLIKYTGLAGRATEVNSISFKSVDSATYLDSIDAMNYPIRAPYGQRPVNYSYENWIKIKLEIDRKYSKYLHGTSIQLPCDQCGDSNLQVYTKIVNPRLLLQFQCFNGFEVKFGFTPTFRAPIRSVSDIATTNIRMIQSNLVDDSNAIEIPLTSSGEIMLGDLESFESEFFVTQLSAFKGCEFENKTMCLSLLYELA